MLATFFQKHFQKEKTKLDIIVEIYNQPLVKYHK